MAESNNDKKLFDVWLSLKCGYKTNVFDKLRIHFANAEDVYNADADSLSSPGINPKQLNALKDKRISKAQEIVKYCNKLGIKIISFGDKEYPNKLRTIPSPPIVLYAIGKLQDTAARLSVAVIGAREMTNYGAYAAEKLAYDLADANAVIVSGLAKGIDAKAHCGAIKASGYTIGVCGTSVDKIYPTENSALFQYMYENQTVISEFPPLTPTPSYSFPVRNRIISGMCDATVVVEAGAESGTLITVASARKQSRDVFAVPHSNGSSPGTVSLLRKGYIPVTSAATVAERYAEKYKDTLNIKAETYEPLEKEIQNGSAAAQPIIYTRAMLERSEASEALSLLSPVEESILKLFGNVSVLSTDAVIASVYAPPSKVLAALTKLQMLDLITQTSNGAWVAK